MDNSNYFNEPLWKVVRSTTPPIGIEGRNATFAKYGYTVGGVCEYFYWDIKKLQNAPEIDLWQMLAISAKDAADFYEKLCRLHDEEKRAENTFTIDEVVDRTEKYIIVKDTNGFIHGINFNGYKVIIE